jgi:hypothetical protein
MLEQLRKEVKLEALVLNRKYTSLGGALYIACCVILPRILYRLKFTPVSCEEIDSLHRHVLDILLSKCGLKGRKANDVIFGGYEGMAWVRWSDKVNSERLKIMMCALQAKNTTFGHMSCVVQHIAYIIRQYTMSDSTALERKFSMVDETIGNSQWLARLWEWTSQNGIRLHCADLLFSSWQNEPRQHA